MIFKLYHKYTKTWELNICRRVSDGTYWVASSNGIGYSMLALFGLGNKFFFRRIHRFRNGYISNFADTWEFKLGREFEMIGKQRIYVERKAWKEYLAL